MLTTSIKVLTFVMRAMALSSTIYFVTLLQMDVIVMTRWVSGNGSVSSQWFSVEDFISTLPLVFFYN